MLKLGQLERVDIGELFKDEAKEFTPWLAQQENLALLGEAIGLDLELVGQEQDVGPFRADILCKDLASGDYVLIENQLGRTDHTHLGQILTYAAGLDAAIIVWIARQMCDEHRAALDWLNQVTDESTNFFGLEVEAWRIGESDPAVRFNVVCQPNEWLKRPPARQEIGPTQQLQLEYWKSFKAFLEEKQSKLPVSRPQPRHWLGVGIGTSRAYLNAVAGTWDEEARTQRGLIRVDLILNPPTAEADFKALHSQRQEIEQEVGEKLTWHSPENSQSRRIYVKKLADIKDRDKWPEQFEWLESRLLAFRRVFAPRIKALLQAAGSDAALS